MRLPRRTDRRGRFEPMAPRTRPKPRSAACRVAAPKPRTVIARSPLRRNSVNRPDADRYGADVACRRP